jgi:hypothetical protein
MKKIVLLFSFVLALVSCSEGDVLETDNLASGPKIVGFRSPSESIAYFSDEGVKDHSFPVVLVGYGNGLLSSTPIALQYEVDLVNSTATEGVEFDFANSSQTVTIPAGSDHGSLGLKVNTGSFNLLQPTELYLKLKPTSGVAVGEKQKSLKITFVGCATALQGNYNTYIKSTTTGLYGFGGTATVSKIAPNVYRSTRLPGISSGGSPLTFDFTDTCGVLEIKEWQFEGGYAMFQTGATSSRPVGVITSTTPTTLEFTKICLTGLSFYQDRSIRLIKI